MRAAREKMEKRITWLGVGARVRGRVQGTGTDRVRGGGFRYRLG